MNPPSEAYPLCWPAGRRRKLVPKPSSFGEHTIEQSRRALDRELRLLGARKVILSTNIELRLDGLPYSNRTPPKDKGVAVYFCFKDRPMVFACDEWTRIEDNIWAVAKTIEALRGIERWGSGEMLERAFTGFTALPAPETKKHWREVLGFMASEGKPSKVNITARRNGLAQQHHPDRGGSGERMAEINRAFDEAMKEIEP